MPKVKANDITIHYERQGAGEPLVLIPYLTADHACYAFQVAEYAQYFTCFSLDLRGTGESDKPDRTYSTELLADDVAAFIHAVGIRKAHVAGMSLGGAVGAWVAAKYPERVQSLSVHATWPKTDPFLQTIFDGLQVMARALGSVPETTILGIFPWCFTPELYAARPDYIKSLADFVRSRPAQPLNEFLHQSHAAATHDVESELHRITAPTLITFGSKDVVTSTRFADRMKAKIPDSELLIFEGCAHAALYEHVEEFNAKTLDFLQRQAAAGVA